MARTRVGLGGSASAYGTFAAKTGATSPVAGTMMLLTDVGRLWWVSFGALARMFT